MIFGRWLPGPWVVIAYLAGTVVLANLLWHGLRYVADRFFWRVRNRLIGSFVIVGLIPLVLLLGALWLVAYSLLGQLASGYLSASIESLDQELAVINAELGEQFAASARDFSLDRAAEAVFLRHRTQFPKLAARLLERNGGGSQESVRVFDPHDSIAGLKGYPPDFLPEGKPLAPGLLRDDERLWLVSLKALPLSGRQLLEVTAPVDEHVQQRLESEKTIYATFLKAQRSSVVRLGGSMEVRVGDTPGRRDSDSEEQIRGMDQRSRSDSRRQIMWLALLHAQDPAAR